MSGILIRMSWALFLLLVVIGGQFSVGLGPNVRAMSFRAAGIHIWVVRKRGNCLIMEMYKRCHNFGLKSKAKLSVEKKQTKIYSLHLN